MLKNNNIYTKKFHFRLIYNETLKQAWFSGHLPGCTHYQVMCKIINTLLWNGITSKTKVINYILYWHSMHEWMTFDYAIYKRAFDFVDGAIREDLRARWAAKKRKQRAKKNRSKLPQTFDCTPEVLKAIAGNMILEGRWGEVCQ